MTHSKLSNMFKLLLAFVLITALMLTLTTGITASPSTDDPPPRLFVAVEPAGGSDDLETTADSAPVIRARLVNIEFDHLQAASSDGNTAQSVPPVNPILRLNLFEDTVLTAVLDRVEPNATGGGYVWLGRIENAPYSMANLVVKNGLLAGDIRTLEGVYQVRPVANGRHVIRQLAPAGVAKNKNDARRPPINSASVPASQIAATRQISASDDGSTIDVLVAYTPQARSAAGGTAAMLLEIDAAIASTHTSYANSGITPRLQLVHTVEIAYTDSGDIDLDLERVTNIGDGYMDNIHALRDTYAADLVSLWVNRSDNDGIGVSWLLTSTDPGAEAEYGFNVIQRAYATNEFTFAHEMGHGLGAEHDWYTDDTAGLYSYSHGLVNRTNRWITIMSYYDECWDAGFDCPIIPYFSNPDVSYNGVPTGVVPGTNLSCTSGDLGHPTCDADNRLTLNNAAWTVANFRVASPESAKVNVTISPTDVQTTTTSLDYSLSLRNGDQEYTGTQVVVDVPAQAATVTNINPSGTYAAGQITWVVGALPKSETRAFSFTISILPDTLNDKEVISGTVQVDSNEGVVLPSQQFKSTVNGEKVFLPIIIR